MNYFKLIIIRSISIEMSVTKRSCPLQRLCTVDDTWQKCDVWKTGGKYWQGKTEYVGDKLVPLALCPPQIPNRRPCHLTKPSAVC